MNELLTNKCLIDGQWVGGEDHPVLNPATGQTIAKVPNLGAVETQQAIDAASKAFKSWSKTLAKDRAKILRRWFDLIVANADELAAILTAEQGKPLTEAKGEVLYAASFIEFFSEEAKRIYGETIPSPFNNGRIIVTKQPIGVVAAITPWNFPAAMITRKVGPALAAGCCCVVKPAQETPLTAFALAKLGQEAGIPDGVLNIVNGDAPPIGNVMCASEDVRALTFTGSTPIGKLLMRQCADTMKVLGLELGGNAPFIVFDDADLEAAVQGAMQSKFRNAGQTCVCANRIYAQAGIYDAFTEKLAYAVAALKVGDGTQGDVQQGPLIDAKAIDKVEELVRDAVEAGAKIVVGGERHALGGHFYQPTVLSHTTSDMRISTEEIFGPVAPVYKFERDEDVIAMANDTRFGLASYFYARDIGRVWRVAEALEFGMVAINSGVLSTEVAPFGGVKESGLGREGSHHGIDEFVETKYMLISGL